MDNRRIDDRKEPEIVYSRSVKAGKRIYYLDVKKARNNDLYLCLTESKRKQTFEDEVPQFEKHKIFIYKEDFSSFSEGLNDVIGYIREHVGEIADRAEWTPENSDDKNEAEAAKAVEQEEETEEREEKKPRRGLFGFVRK